MPLYSTRQPLISLNKQNLEQLLDIRELENITVYRNYTFSSNFKEKDYDVIEHIWSQGDKLNKLAHRYYGNREMFWMIGLFNKKPTDAHYTYGDIVLIPVDGQELYRDMVG